MVNKYQEITAGCVPVREKAGKWYERRAWPCLIRSHESFQFQRILQVFFQGFSHSQFVPLS